MSRNGTWVYRSAIRRPRVLLVVSHPTVGAGLEMLLRLERRYDVRRVAKLGDALRLAPGWPPDAVLVDAALLSREAPVRFGAPALVLAAAEAEHAAAARMLDDPRGWVAKDAPSADLVRSVERLLTLGSEPTAGPVALSVVGALILVFAGLLLYLLWTALV